jgi:hypothetical protein
MLSHLDAEYFLVSLHWPFVCPGQLALPLIRHRHDDIFGNPFYCPAALQIKV